jgi:hypothetical protein
VWCVVFCLCYRSSLEFEIEIETEVGEKPRSRKQVAALELSCGQIKEKATLKCWEALPNVKYHSEGPDWGLTKDAGEDVETMDPESTVLSIHRLTPFAPSKSHFTRPRSISSMIRVP